MPGGEGNCDGFPRIPWASISLIGHGAFKNSLRGWWLGSCRCSDILSLQPTFDAVHDRSVESDWMQSFVGQLPNVVVGCLLRAKRAKAGGGKGNDPGKGNRDGPDMNSSALALLGESDEDKAKIVERDVHQATGPSGNKYPEEFQFGLDKYFEALEKNR